MSNKFIHFAGICCYVGKHAKLVTNRVIYNFLLHFSNDLLYD